MVARREIVNGSPWLGVAVHVVEDSPGLLASYICEGAPFGFVDEHPHSPHPWSGRPAWTGHGVLMLQRPGELHAIWHFWHGPERRFDGWYVNIQEPFRRTSIGYDTQDLELDVLVGHDGRWAFKDRELMPERVAEGRFSQAVSDAAFAEAERVIAMVESGTTWWDPAWATWSPPPDWRPEPLPEGWAT